MNDLNLQLERPNVPTAKDGELARESWKIFQIMAEFVEGFEKLASIPRLSAYSARRAPGPTIPTISSP